MESYNLVTTVNDTVCRSYVIISLRHCHMTNGSQINGNEAPVFLISEYSSHPLHGWKFAGCIVTFHPAGQLHRKDRY